MPAGVCAAALAIGVAGVVEHSATPRTVLLFPNAAPCAHESLRTSEHTARRKP